MREGETAIQQGEKGDSFYVVLSGTFEVFLEQGPAAHPSSPQRVNPSHLTSSSPPLRPHRLIPSTPQPLTPARSAPLTYSLLLAHPYSTPIPSSTATCQSYSEVPVHTYSTPGDGFGELALLYHTRCAAGL